MQTSTLKSELTAELVKIQLGLIGKRRLQTNDIVEISGRMVRINADPLLGLKTHDLAVLLVLAQESPSGSPLTAKEIVSHIEAKVLPEGLSWIDPQPEQVHAAVWRLRNALASNADLIESVQGLGYRLSTPHVNVTITGAHEKKRERSARKRSSMQGFSE